MLHVGDARSAGQLAYRQCCSLGGDVVTSVAHGVNQRGKARTIWGELDSGSLAGQVDPRGSYAVYLFQRPFNVTHTRCAGHTMDGQYNLLR